MPRVQPQHRGIIKSATQQPRVQQQHRGPVESVSCSSRPSPIQPQQQSEHFRKVVPMADAQQPGTGTGTGTGTGSRDGKADQYHLRERLRRSARPTLVWADIEDLGQTMGFGRGEAP